MNRLVVLEDARLRALAKNPAVSHQFPFLKPLLQRARSCCAKPSVDTNAIKAAVAGLSGSDLQTLKQRLAATTIRVVYSVDGKTVIRDI